MDLTADLLVPGSGAIHTEVLVTTVVIVLLLSFVGGAAAIFTRLTRPPLPRPRRTDRGPRASIPFCFRFSWRWLEIEWGQRLISEEYFHAAVQEKLSLQKENHRLKEEIETLQKLVVLDNTDTPLIRQRVRLVRPHHLHPYEQHETSSDADRQLVANVEQEEQDDEEEGEEEELEEKVVEKFEVVSSDASSETTLPLPPLGVGALPDNTTRTPTTTTTTTLTTATAVEKATTTTTTLRSRVSPLDLPLDGLSPAKDDNDGEWSATTTSVSSPPLSVRDRLSLALTEDMSDLGVSSSEFAVSSDDEDDVFFRDDLTGGSSASPRVASPRLSQKPLPPIPRSAPVPRSVCTSSPDLRASPSGGASSTPPPKARRTDAAKKRKVLLELFETEQSYVKNLDIFVRLFVKPSLKKGFITKEEHHTVFHSIESILEHHRILVNVLAKRCADLLAEEEMHKTSSSAIAARSTKSPRRRDLQQGQGLQIDVRIADIFMNLTIYLNGYSAYAQNYANATSTLRRLLTEKSQFNKDIRRAEGRKECHFLDVFDFLIMPIQRPIHYINLLNEMLKHTAASEPDHEELTKALLSVRNIADSIDQSSGPTSSVHEIMAIQARISSKVPMSLLTPFRKFVKDQRFTFLTGRNKRKKRQVFLFNDIMLVTKPLRPIAADLVAISDAGIGNFFSSSNKHHTDVTFRHKYTVDLAKIEMVEAVPDLSSFSDSENATHMFTFTFKSDARCEELVHASTPPLSRRSTPVSLPPTSLTIPPHAEDDDDELVTCTVIAETREERDDWIESLRASSQAQLKLQSTFLSPRRSVQAKPIAALLSSTKARPRSVPRSLGSRAPL
eukprot:TRINITY_DN16661_c0_g1_i1.p1 TRINITY_DN16661_c0_g1~~TRINITY_DN16661_c0_g1_i1.p1  ORF type:complete len:840 (+),score=178.22 TRINITY_DN16661_c0_g1_i1:140-2659(+)